MSDLPTFEAPAANSRSRWVRALEDSGPDRIAAFSDLAASYWYCVYAWWRRSGLAAADAGRATLACFTRWLGEAPPSTLDSGAARMREWVAARLTDLGEQVVEFLEPAAITIDPDWAERRYADEPPGAREAIFQRRWAISVIEFTASTLAAEYAARGEEALFEEVLAFAGFETSDEDRYAAAAARTNRSSGAMRKAVFDFRARQREVLRAFVADTVLAPGDADSEITALLCACDAPGPEAANAPLPSTLQALRPEEVLARAMQSVRLSKGGPGGWQPPSVEEVARLFPQYEVSALLGRGGMGAVYKAREVELDRFVAIKLLPLEVSVDRDFADRFRREARAMAKLNHPNIITVHEFGTTDEGHLFFAMDFVEGANLQEMIRGPGLAPLQALVIISGVCDALAYAHGKGVVHRDIKPANVMVNIQGHVRVADFGLARLTDSAAEQAGHSRNRDSRGHAGLHGAGAKARDACRSPGGYLQPWGDALRDALQGSAARHLRSAEHAGAGRQRAGRSCGDQGDAAAARTALSIHDGDEERRGGGDEHAFIPAGKAKERGAAVAAAFHAGTDAQGITGTALEWRGRRARGGSRGGDFPGADTVGKAYFFDGQRQLLSKFDTIPAAIHPDGSYGLPPLLRAHTVIDVYVPIETVDKDGKWHSVVLVFGDPRKLVADVYPRRAGGTWKDFDFPERGTLTEQLKEAGESKE